MKAKNENEVYNGGFAAEFSVSLLKENIALVRDYLELARWFLLTLTH